MIRPKLLMQVARLRHLRLDRSAVALARSNELAAEQSKIAKEAEALRAHLEADLGPGLRRHLQTAAALGGVNERFASFVVSATADRHVLARQVDHARVAKSAAEAAQRQAEICRDDHTKLVRRVGGLEELIGKLDQYARRIAAPLEEDRVQEQHQARVCSGERQ